MRNITIILTLLIALNAAAQDDQKAREILEQTSEKMQSFQSLSASFSFTMENAKMNVKEKNSGSLLLKGKKYQVKLPDLGMQVFSDGITVWNYMKEANQVTMSAADDDSQGGLDPTAIFNIYQEGYEYKFIEEKRMSDIVIVYIELLPKDKNKEFSKLVVGIEKNKMLINSLITYGKDGNIYGINITEIKTNQPISDMEFVFDKAQFKNVEVVDFR